VQITGSVAAPSDERRALDAGPLRRRPRAERAERRVAGRPDRIAMYAVLLGVLLILCAALSGSEAGAATTPKKLGERALKVGMVGRDVRHLQLRLRRLGFLDAPATARFGALTRRAVRAYQRSRCLTVDGVAGGGTVRALRRGRRACRGRDGGGTSRGTARRASRTYRAVPLGTRTLARGMRGNDVRTLQRLLGRRSDGVFGRRTTSAVRRFQRRAGLTADGAVGPATRSALADRRMRGRTATWYGPGLYGNRTACGQTLTRRLQGVAHRRLPCGARVVLHHGGRFVTARVVDRGPFTKGVTFDLTSATAKRLGVATTVRVRAAY